MLIKKGRFYKKTLIYRSFLATMMFVALAILLLPQSTHAGVLSFVSDFFAKADSSLGQNGSVNTGTLGQTGSNSQNMVVLQSATNIDPNPTKKEADLSIIEGEALESSSGPSGTAVDVVRPSSDQISVYTVREGDSLSVIAQMFDVSPNTILWANDLKNSKDLKKGQTLVILPISGVKYVVKKGDTLKSIASSFKGDIDEILRFNDLPDDHKLQIGEEIIIPDGEISYPATVSKTSKTSTAPLIDATGYFMRPVSGGYRTQGLHGACRCGIDIASKSGTPIYAAADGRVIVSKTGGWNGGYGNYVVISHSNGTQTLYAHNTVNLVSVGDTVSKGDQIASMGSTGNSTGNHVHFEVRGARNPF